MVITKRQDVTKQGFGEVSYSEFIHSSGWGGGERLFEAGHLLNFQHFQQGKYLYFATKQ